MNGHENTLNSTSFSDTTVIIPEAEMNENRPNTATKSRSVKNGLFPFSSANTKGVTSRRGSNASSNSKTGSRPNTSQPYALQSVGTLRGPILYQSFFMYVVFILIVLSAELLGWAPNIRIQAFVPYICISIILLEVGRVAGAFKGYQGKLQTLIPLYTSLIPFAVLCFLSREAHVLVSVMYFCSALIIYLQSGLPSLQFHIMIWIASFLLIYTIIVIIMLLYYIDTTGHDFFYGRVLDPSISPGQETTVIICLALLGTGFLLLEKFVKLYANTLFERTNTIQALEIEQEVLRQELKKMKEQEKPQIDVDAPVQKVLAILQEISADGDIDPTTKEQLNFVIKVIASNKLYDPNITDKQTDTEYSSWLQNMLNAGETRKDSAKLGGVLLEKKASKVTRFLPNADSTTNTAMDTLSDRIDDWELNIFEVADITTGRPLFFVAYSLFIRHDLIKKFGIDDSKLRRFLSIIESGYDNKNPYHNSTHAADVVQTLNYFLSKGGLSQYLTELDILAALVAAIIHDYEHPGLNNAYHINVQSELAVRYNDKSVLENYHSATAFGLLYDESNNIFGGLTDSQRKELRETIVTMVLATDMAQHFDLLAKFKGKLTANGFDPKDRKDRLLLLQIAIKCADISNPTKKEKACVAWAQRVMEEFYKQGDEERRRGMPVSAFMDRNKPAEAKCQLGFIDFIVGPLFEVWTNFLPETHFIMDILDSNRNYWKRKEAAELRSSTAT